MCILSPRIDRKMSTSQTNYKLDEAQAIFNELRSIKKAISTGEKERQDLIQVSDSFFFFFLTHFLYFLQHFPPNIVMVGVFYADL